MNNVKSETTCRNQKTLTTPKPIRGLKVHSKKYAALLTVLCLGCRVLSYAQEVNETVHLKVTVTNLAPENGTYLTPVWIAFHDGSFDLFNPDEPASSELERLAEDGNTGPLSEAFLASGVGGFDATVTSGEGPPVFAPGQMRTVHYRLDANNPRNRYLSFASMVIPSNDAFIGNGDPQAYPIFDNDGQLVATPILRLGSQVYDAGTEVNDELPPNTAFFGQATPNTGDDENGVVHPHQGFNAAGQGGILDDPMFANADFTAGGYSVFGLNLDLAFAISPIQITGNQTSLEWIGGTAPYQVQWRASVGEGTWQSVDSPTDANTASFELDEPQAFFRVISAVEPASQTAQYEVTFDATWSAATHPTDFPANPHFSGLIGATHDARVSFWEPGGTASAGIERMAETGGKSPLDSEVNAAIAAGTAEHLLSGGGIGTSPGSRSLSFGISQDHSLVSLVSMIAPSPDWFVGVHGLSLFEGGQWVEEIVIQLDPYDSGTDNGISYASSNDDANPRGTIMRLTGSPVEVDGSVPPFGTFSFTRVN